MVEWTMSCILASVMIMMMMKLDVFFPTVMITLGWDTFVYINQPWLPAELLDMLGGEQA